VSAEQPVEQQEEQPVVEDAQPDVQQEERPEYVELLDEQQEEQLVSAELLVEVPDAQHELELVQLAVQHELELVQLAVQHGLELVQRVGAEEVQDVQVVDAQADVAQERLELEYAQPVETQEDRQETDLVIIEDVAEEKPPKITILKKGIGITAICGN
jgi:hypothetical protein